MIARAARGRRRPQRARPCQLTRSAWPRKIAGLAADRAMTLARSWCRRGFLVQATPQCHVARGLNLQDGMRQAVARDHEPCSAAADVLPQFAMRASGIVAQVNIVDPTLPRPLVEGLVRLAVRPLDGCVTEVDELLVPARPTVTAVDPHAPYLQCRLGCAPAPFSSIKCPVA